MSIRMEVNAARIKNGVPRKARKRRLSGRGLLALAWFISTISFVSSKEIVRTMQTISARPKATPFGKRTPFAAYLRLLQER